MILSITISDKMVHYTATHTQMAENPLKQRAHADYVVCSCVVTPFFDMAQKEMILGQVVAKANNYQAVPDGKGGRRIIKSDSVREYERSFINQCIVYAGKMIDCPFTLEVVVYESSRRYDLDNSLKTILDCLQMCNAITDDNLCTEIHARKAIDPSRPRIVFAIHEAEPRLI